ncbi:helix-turn-helix domain-containing protein [Nocardioides carbamazepini]|uniref:helix-turn-helix transcriptional regulator n=1 Tax=Nocardioides carbamazepini TaxID=2854259 RepID=UPI0021499AAD|nr:helix-turn-helix domain-containing protein [Nocardioides carbamazepini]MCR1781946.1 helix-turn-helix domain-containing protein [Nocardioides carbamazepini]
MDLDTGAAAIGVLTDPTRRSLYAYVAARGDLVGRDEAATALGLAKHTVSFHLDRLAEEGLLEVEFRRLSGRTGPGAGRPSKLYRRARRDFTVSLPPRRYDLVGDILAAAVGRAGAGEDLDTALADCAHTEGRAVAGQADGVPAPPGLDDLAAVLSGQGYEPTVEASVVALANCPFDALARKHTALVCGLNRSFVQGVADGLGCAGVTAHLEPDAARCCVTVRRDGQPAPAHGRAALDRWILSGGHWEVAGERDGIATVALLTCDGGQEMDRVTLPVDALPAD